MSAADLHYGLVSIQIYNEFISCIQFMILSCTNILPSTNENKVKFN